MQETGSVEKVYKHIFLVRIDYDSDVLHAYTDKEDAKQHIRDHNIRNGWVEEVDLDYPLPN